ncbi:heme biosynthesis HemY N-terminal domain-containing protein [Variovorax dokdonensis]|uniref:Heme biosynthesis HemY N-terminal domain-containing protein n=1 Tax=Variovorax dokdonensis TaxID=344883 RepID=A0ABT7N6I1_9BURK|nr:heme biosynthesis HemY N-terminal domain-containing protein [Variovorax dokdonensis]MDM0043537.1 heme biosynthesis HemY N-terminal domain-containing protein [Variovorax dokdonensis]
MRAALWLLALFGIAAGVALFAGSNEGTITVFWPPWRIDLSLNLVLMLALGLFVVLHLALRGLGALLSLPAQARQWRMQQKERALHTALLESIVQLLAGRFSRAAKAAQSALAQERTLEALNARLPMAAQVRTLSHLLAAESANSLQDKPSRDAHLQHALSESGEGSVSPETREGVQLRAAYWALQDRDAQAALARLQELPHGAQRRTLALRLWLKAARLDGRTLQALETARLLAKHRAFSQTAAHSIIRGLATDLLSEAHDPSQLQHAWSELDAMEREMPEVALHAAQRQVLLRGDPAVARNWLLPIWDRMTAHPDRLSDSLRVKLTRALEVGLDSVDAEWLARIETAQRNDPRDPNLQYLAGMACLKRQLWGKAQQLLTQAGLGLKDPGLHRQAWQALARLAEERGDPEQAAMAWKRAAESDSGR